MSHRALLIIATVLATGAAFADDPRPRGEPDIDRLTTLLELDDYQAHEVERILTEHRMTIEARQQELRALGGRPDKETMEAERANERASLHAELATVLTTEQLEKFDVLGEMCGGSPRGRPRRGDFDDSEMETR